MELREAAQTIRDTVSMDQVLALYGYKTRHGFMVCPFHGDHDASLRVYPGTGGWHCFGCGRGGSVIDWVMEHDGCDFKTAVKALDGAMGLGLLKDEDPLQEWRRRELAACLDGLTEILLQQIRDDEQWIEIQIRLDTGKAAEIESKPRILRTAREIAELENLYAGMEYEEYQKQRLDEVREEVRAWRRSKRRKAR